MPQLMKTGIHRWASPSLIRDFDHFIDCVKVLCNRRSKSTGTNMYTDVFTVMQRAHHPKTEVPLWTKAELNSESALLVLAGSDTIATALSATLFYLAHNSESLAKAQAEVLYNFSDPEDIFRGKRLSTCQYLRACIDEAMRMSPSVAGTSPRKVLHGGLDIDGLHIPQYVEVGTPTYAIHHDPDYFPDPFSFTPERWLSQENTSHSSRSSKEQATAGINVFRAFGKGPRECAAKRMAYHEMMTVLASVLWTFEVRLAVKPAVGKRVIEEGGSQQRRDGYQLLDFFAAAGQGPELCFKRRC